ncbi:putative membrane protein [Brevibacillus sp. AG162]|uniref:DUF2085 domain-containing protein n=1 Tax=Brevibacillus sp. AG162 TaxID=2572910 RepID=UPI00114E242C|nr:DUF2085 domain-containing protein [Brevibacillus sp. AG162]TQK53859.1 putative membrane protein [Brevibacillus sp. AG162]
MKINTQWIPCHRRADRSFYIGGKKMPLCARCVSILAGYLLAPVFAGMHIVTSYYLIGFLLLPMLIDGFTQQWKWRTSNNMLRFFTGFSFGIGQSLLISNVVWFLVERLG